MKEIKDILENYTQQPPASGWERLSSQLDALAPMGGESAATSSTGASAAGTAAKGAAFSVSKALLVAAAGLLTTAAVVTAVIVHNEKSNIQSTELPNGQAADNSMIVLTDSTITATPEEEKTLVAKDVAPTENPTSNLPSDNTPVAAPATTPLVDNTPSTPAAIPTTSSPKVSASPAKTPTPTPSLQRPNVTPTLTHVTLPQQSTILHQQQEDPVVQKMDPDEMDWSTPVRIEIPNVFTPNGDGFNDLFVIQGLENCDKHELIVRNRGGNIVFRSNSYENNWNGDNCPDGTYSYQFLYSRHGISQEMKGNVMIIRK